MHVTMTNESQYTVTIKKKEGQSMSDDRMEGQYTLIMTERKVNALSSLSMHVPMTLCIFNALSCQKGRSIQFTMAEMR